MKYLDVVNEDTIDHAIKYLTNYIFSESERRLMSEFFIYNNRTIMINESARQLLSGKYLDYVMDTLEYGINKYLIDFKNVDYGIPFFKHYEKYSKADTLILSNVIGRSPNSIREGVSNIGDNYLIFINLHKDEEQ